MFVPYLGEIEKFEAIERAVASRQGIRLLNLSTWIVAEEFKEGMNRCFENGLCDENIEYIYSYDIAPTVKKAVLTNLGVPDHREAALLFTQNNTISIVNIVNFLKRANIARIGIVGPSYFSIEHAMFSFGMPFSRVPLAHDADFVCSLPSRETLNRYGAVWITSPIYSTGQYYSREDINTVKGLLADGVYILADESFALSGNELIRDCGSHPFFIGIYSPHKSIQMNAVKFSMIAYHRKHREYFEQWVDIFAGNLLHSNFSAIYHYISDNYKKCFLQFNNYMKSAFENVRAVLDDYPGVKYNKRFKGNLMRLFLPHLHYTQLRSEQFLTDLMSATRTSIIPGYLNGFHESFGFNFRLNLACANNRYYQGLRRLLTYLHEL